MCGSACREHRGRGSGSWVQYGAHCHIGFCSVVVDDSVDVRQGCVITVARGFRRPHAKAQRYEHESLEKLIHALEGAPPADSSDVSFRDWASSQRVCQLGDVIEIRLGGVTGDAEFFLLSE